MTQDTPFGESDPPRAPSPSEPPSGTASHAPEAVQTLRQAMRRARFDDAERVGVLAELRATQIGRLELLQEALRPLLAQIPRDVDLFDVGIMPGATPRLFIDMIGFVEMGRDARVYRLLQDTRHNRVTIAESAAIDTMVDAVTDYVARRLLERDKALVSDALDKPAETPGRADVSPSRPAGEVASGSASQATTPAVIPLSEPPSATRWAGMAFGFVIDLLGATALFTIVAFALWIAWNRLHGAV